MLHAANQLFVGATPITPSNTANSNRFPALYVVVAGNVVVTPQAADGQPGGADITITGALVGQLIPFGVTAVKSTGTTATVVGLL